MRQVTVRTLRFKVVGVPVAWSRTRITTSGLGRIRLVNSANLTAYEDQVASAAAIAARVQGWKRVEVGAVSLGIMFYLPIAASLSKRKREALVGMPHAQRPDLDNLVKAILDGCTKAGVWRDDAQIAHLSAHKLLRVEPGVEVEVVA